METYLGIYIRAVRKSNESIEEIKVCPRGHSVNEMDNYCPSCGSKLKVIGEKTNGQLSFYTMMGLEIIDEKFEDVITAHESTDENADILVPNYSIARYGIFLSEEGETHINEHPPFSVFENEYDDFITAISPHYKSIELDYGVVNWYD